MEENYKILIVDDEIDIVELLRLRLQINNFSVMTALDGIQALEQVAIEIPDLIVMDIKMPRLNGYKVTKKLREDSKTDSIPIFIITALSKYTSNVAEQCQELGVQQVFYKPFETTELITAIQTCLKIPAPE